jgi:hypothetical protein
MQELVFLRDQVEGGKLEGSDDGLREQTSVEAGDTLFHKNALGCSETISVSFTALLCRVKRCVLHAGRQDT